MADWDLLRVAPKLSQVATTLVIFYSYMRKLLVLAQCTHFARTSLKLLARKRQLRHSSSTREALLTTSTSHIATSRWTTLTRFSKSRPSSACERHIRFMTLRRRLAFMCIFGDFFSWRTIFLPKSLVYGAIGFAHAYNAIGEERPGNWPMLTRHIPMRCLALIGLIGWLMVLRVCLYGEEVCYALA